MKHFQQTCNPWHFAKELVNYWVNCPEIQITIYKIDKSCFRFNQPSFLQKSVCHQIEVVHWYGTMVVKDECRPTVRDVFLPYNRLWIILFIGSNVFNVLLPIISCPCQIFEKIFQYQQAACLDQTLIFWTLNPQDCWRRMAQKTMFWQMTPVMMVMGGMM